MARVFSITTAATALQLDVQGRSECSFTVTNVSGRALRGRAELRATNAAHQGWLTITGDPERDYPPNGTQQIAVRVAVPAGSPAGKSGFRLDVVSTENSDEDFAEGPTMAFDVAPPAPRKPFPWWIVAAAAALVLIVGGASAYLLTRSKAPEATAEVAEKAATPPAPEQTPAATTGTTPAPAPDPPSPPAAPQVSARSVVDIAGRKMTFENVKLNGQGNVAQVAPGASVAIAFHWAMQAPDDPNLYCPGCIIQVYYGIDRAAGGFAKCIVSGLMGRKAARAGDIAGTFAAPATPGTYYVTSTSTFDYSCKENVANPGKGPENALAALVVR